MGFGKMTMIKAMRCILPWSLLLLLLAACTTEPEEVDTPNVPATVQAEVANQLAAAPTATPWPTHTPYPTATAYPTSTPYPTGTPLPTASPYPTATPYPTYTPYPTPRPAATPRPLPTYTPYPTPTPPATTTQQAAPTATPTAGPTRLAFDSYAELDSGDRADHILRTHVLASANCDPVADLSMELSRQQDIAILKVYEMRIIFSNSTRVECAGTARWSRGENTPIWVFVENDRDDGNFYGYRFPARGYD
jgi:hypothetical protein